MKRRFAVLLCMFFGGTACKVSAQAPVVRFEIKTDNLPVTTTHNAINSSALRTNDAAALAVPSIVYPTPQVYAINQPIPPLSPANTGGPMPTDAYGKVTTLGSFFATVTGVVMDSQGNIFVADYGSNQIKKISPAGVISVFAGQYTSGYIDANGTAAAFNWPDALAVDKNDNIYVAEAGNHIIRKITPAGQVSTLAGNIVAGSANGTGTAASFNTPRGMCFDNAENLYVADQGNNLIRKITPAGVVTTYAGTGTSGFTNGQRLSATFNTPTAVVVDAAGNMYVSDASNNVIRKIAADGTVSTYATGFNFPREARFDATGNLYVNDENNYTIKKISPAGIVTTVAGSGAQGFADGNANTASFNQPIGLGYTNDGSLLIGDVNTVRKVSLGGYSIDKPLPAGLVFDPTTGIISGTPTALSPPTDYVITAHNAAGSSSATVRISVANNAITTTKLPSLINIPAQSQSSLGSDGIYDTRATSTNNETPITFTSSDPSIAYILPDGRIKVQAPGQVTIAAHQAGNAHYDDAQPVTTLVTIIEYMAIYLPPISNRLLCTADFDAGGVAAEPKFPLKYTSSNTSVATVDDNGHIHLVGVGSATITLSQDGQLPYYVAASPQTQTFTVLSPIIPAVSIAADQPSVCAASAITFTATPQNAGTNPSYQWKVNNVNAGSNSAVFSSTSLINGDKVTCTITNTANACISTYTGTSNAITANIITPVNPSVSISPSVNAVFPGTPITFTASVKNSNNSVVNYQWYVNGVPAGNDNAVFTSDAFVNGDVVTCTIAPAAACSTPATSTPVTVVIVTKVEIPNTFTPNSDGINDKWEISGIGSYPDCLVNVYNRYGKLVYSSKGYAAPWDGIIESGAAPVATYYYVINLNFKHMIMSGHVTVIR